MSLWIFFIAYDKNSYLSVRVDRFHACFLSLCLCVSGSSPVLSGCLALLICLSLLPPVSCGSASSGRAPLPAGCPCFSLSEVAVASYSRPARPALSCLPYSPHFVRLVYSALPFCLALRADLPCFVGWRFLSSRVLRPVLSSLSSSAVLHAPAFSPPPLPGGACCLVSSARPAPSTRSAFSASAPARGRPRGAACFACPALSRAGRVAGRG